MRRGELGRAVAFAAVAACVCPFVLGLATPLLGAALAWETMIIGSVALYLAWVVPGRTLGRAAGLTSLVVAAAILVLGGGQAALALGLASTLSCVRCLTAKGGGATRNVWIELALVGTGLALAGHLLASPVLPEALALWGFYLVQSAHGLLARGPGNREPEIDRFTRAARRIEALL